jgi:hypothetical protein
MMFLVYYYHLERPDSGRYKAHVSLVPDQFMFDIVASIENFHGAPCKITKIEYIKEEEFPGANHIDFWTRAGKIMTQNHLQEKNQRFIEMCQQIIQNEQLPLDNWLGAVQQELQQQIAETCERFWNDEFKKLLSP